MLNKIQHNKVIEPKTQLVIEPKFSLPLPPPKDAAPTDNNEKPIAVTTLAETIGVISLSQYLAKRPKTPSIKPPTNTAPTMAL